MASLKRVSFLSPSKKQRFAIHLLFWLLLFTVRLYLTGITFNVYSGFPVTSILLLNLFSTVLIASFYYILTERAWTLAKNGRRLHAAALLLVCLVAYSIADALFEQLAISRCGNCLILLKDSQPAYYQLLQSGLINIVLKRLLSLGTPFSLLLTLAIPLCLKMALNAWRGQVNALELARHNVELEFNFLKAQINPHFLFNTMNNIYGLILKEDTARSAELVARLSGLLRYMLYETNESHIPLKKELKLLTDYIELEKVRLNYTRVTVDISADSMDYDLPPLLLLPLLENAFKFCSDEKGSYIHLFVDVMQGRMRFTLDNTIDTDRLTAAGSGIGLANFRKRLDLYYPGKYWHECVSADGIYSVNLSIGLL